MADYEHSDISSFCFFDEKMPDLALGDEIQHGCDLVCQKETGSLSQGSCNAEALSYNPETLSRSDASRLIDKIILQYGRVKPQNKWGDKMLNMRDPKVKKIISTVIVVILVLAMIVPMALSALMY